MKMKANGILSGILFVTLFLSGCKASQVIGIRDDVVETDEQGLIVFSDEESDDELVTEENEPEEQGFVIGLSFPDEKSEGRNLPEITLLKKSFLDKGYSVKGMNTVETVEEQISQIQMLIDGGVDALVIKPIDVFGLAEVLQSAQDRKIPVFSYRDLIMDTDAVNYLFTYNYRVVGQDVAKVIAADFELEKKTTADPAVTIEFLMGDGEKQNDRFFLKGMFEVFQSYMDNGVLSVPSQKLKIEENSVLSSGVIDKEKIRNRLDEMEKSDNFPKIICCASDEICQEVIAWLNDKNMDAESEDWPYLTGLGCAKDSVKDIAQQKQKFSLFFDGRLLANQCVEEIDKYLHDSELEVSDYGTYDNGLRIVGAMLSQVQIIDEDDYQILIDNGYYDETEIEPSTELWMSVTENVDEPKDDIADSEKSE
ncbi:MAG: substrate-binding domain-containing protein [Eubacteriales bacterium]|nr:substrate-binding domain-containing protein [Eubacteriales bacterium]